MKLLGFVSRAMNLREAAAVIFVLVALLPFAATYLLVTTLGGVPEALALTRRLRRRRGPA